MCSWQKRCELSKMGVQAEPYIHATGFVKPTCSEQGKFPFSVRGCSRAETAEPERNSARNYSNRNLVSVTWSEIGKRVSKATTA